MITPEVMSQHELEMEKHHTDDSGDEAFLLNEFYYYSQNFVTLKGLYYQW